MKVKDHRMGCKINNHYLLIAITLLMAGCTSMAPWQTLTFTGHKIPTVGALNAGNTRPHILRRCIQARNSYAKCDYGFKGSNQNIVNIYDDLLPSLDDHAERIPKLKPWVKKARMRNTRSEESFPYKMYLLTISPAIVLVVPATPGYKEYSPSRRCDRLLTTGCIQSQSYRGNAYWFQEQPPVIEGSFWFSPNESSGSIHMLDLNQRVQDIVVGNTILRISKFNSKWDANRVY
ncbi:MAG: hypothetical protein RPV21_08640 [Candidatus Sedimenticola sp. (ex Thyasira tokunagai)]